MTVWNHMAAGGKETKVTVKGSGCAHAMVRDALGAVGMSCPCRSCVLVGRLGESRNLQARRWRRSVATARQAGGAAA